MEFSFPCLKALVVKISVFLPPQLRNVLYLTATSRLATLICQASLGDFLFFCQLMGNSLRRDLTVSLMLLTFSQDVEHNLTLQELLPSAAISKRCILNSYSFGIFLLDT